MRSDERVERIGQLEKQLVNKVKAPWEVETVEYHQDADMPSLLQAKLILRCEKPAGGIL